MPGFLRRLVDDFLTRDTGTRQGYSWRIGRLADGTWIYVVEKGPLRVGGNVETRRAARRAVDNFIWREAQL